MNQFIVEGGFPLKGDIAVSGSKNAALPILAATLLTSEPCVIHNVPDIRDTHTMLELLAGLGSKILFEKNTVRIQTKKINFKKFPGELACKMRASVLLAGPLIARFGEVNLPYPGGCVLGARPMDTHDFVFKALGSKEIKSKNPVFHYRGKPNPGVIVMPEMSVTGTENAVMGAALTHGQTKISLAALEPHVQDVCHFINKMGGHVEGIGTHTLTVNGERKLHGAEYTVTSDYLEVGTFALAGILTGGEITIHNVQHDHLDAFWNALREMGVPFELRGTTVHIKSSKKTKIKSLKRLQTNIFPGFPTDLQPPFTILLTQANGQSYVHEALFEGRFSYFAELTKMGAKVKRVTEHQAMVNGPTLLHGARVKSCDIRAGAAMILAALIAKGKTTITDIQYIERGYERMAEKLQKLGAHIVRKAD